MTFKKIPVAIIPGDGIGPDIMNATTSVLYALDAPYDFVTCEAGFGAFEKYGEALPQATLDVIKHTRLALKGPLATPPGGGYRSATVRMREAFGLFANVRPGKTLAPGRYDNVDIILVRENLQGMYVGKEHYIKVGDDDHAIGVGTGYNTKEGAKRVLRYTFDMAIKLGRKKVTVVHKSNILKILSGVFLEAANELAPEYADKLIINDMIVDACAMNLVLHPEKFDVIVTTNLFGDILSDVVAGLVGGLGLVPGANIGPDAAIFEAVHGTAPDIAGKGVANPSALMLAAAMMLEHTGHQEKAVRLRAAIKKCIDQGQTTGDLGGNLNTNDYTVAVINAL